MDWLSLANLAISEAAKWRKKTENKKLKAQLNNHGKDIQEVIQKMGDDLPRADLKETGNIRGFVVDKKNKLATRALIPADIRKEGNQVYSGALSRIDAVREKFLAAA